MSNWQGEGDIGDTAQTQTPSVRRTSGRTPVRKGHPSVRRTSGRTPVHKGHPSERTKKMCSEAQKFFFQL